MELVLIVGGGIVERIRARLSGFLHQQVNGKPLIVP